MGKEITSVVPVKMALPSGGAVFVPCSFSKHSEKADRDSEPATVHIFRAGVFRV